MVGIVALLRTTGEIASVVKVIRAPLFIALFTSVGLFLPEQTREVYRILAQPWRAYGSIQLVFAGLTLVLATLTPWIIGRHLTYLYARDLLRQDNVAGLLTRWLPRICGAMIPLGLALGLFIAAGELEFRFPPPVLAAKPSLASVTTDAAHVAFSLRCAGVLAVLSAGAFLTATFLRKRGRGERSGLDPVWSGGYATLGVLVLIVATSVWVSVAPVSIPQAMGALSILLFFTVTLIVLLGSLTAYFDSYRVPVLSSIFVLGVAFSAFGWNDNHAIRLRDRTPTKLPGAREALHAWLDSRADKDHYSGKPYPVFFVTAAGGGMYAAYHAATVLARLQDRCPNFAQHVFSISGVSGGSLGAAVFTGLAKHRAPNATHQDCLVGPTPIGPLEKKVESYFLGADLLAPVVAATLFPDFLQRFLPLAVGHLDRARALEASLAAAWTRTETEHAGGNPFAEPFLTHWDASNPGPALILNATDVEHGYRVVIAPFEVVDLRAIGNISTITRIVEFHKLLGKPPGAAMDVFAEDLSLATAVGLSARFPWILPAGRLTNAEHDLRMVDGGYIENSGVETTLDLLRAVQTSYWGTGTHKISVHLLVISDLGLLETRAWQGIGEILSPLRTMLSTRTSRGTLAIYRASNFADDCFADKRCNRSNAQFAMFPLNLIDYPIPLGWQLSPLSATLVGLHSGYADKENSGPAANILDGAPDPRIFGYFNMANESSCAIEKLLSDRDSVVHCGPR